jgi:hypothetical protein
LWHVAEQAELDAALAGYGEKMLPECSRLAGINEALPVFTQAGKARVEVQQALWAFSQDPA